MSTKSGSGPKHRYLQCFRLGLLQNLAIYQAFGRPVLPNTIIYAPFALSYWSSCKPRRDRVPAKSIAIYCILGQSCSQTSLFTSFWEASVPKQHYLGNIDFSYWSSCKPRRDPLPAKSIAIYSVLGQGCSKTSLFTGFWEASAPKHHYLQHICFHILVQL